MSLENWTFATETDGTFPVGDYTYREGRQSGTGSLGDNPSGTRIFIIDGEYLAEFVDDLLGYATPSGTSLNRVLPEEHPYLSYFYATAATYRPWGQPTTTGKGTDWPVYEVTVTYTPLPYGVYADKQVSYELERYVSIETQSKVEYLQANNVGMQFVSRSDNKSVQTSPGVLVPSVVQQYRWHDLPAPDSTDDNPLGEFSPPCLQTYTAMIGKTNSLTFNGNPPRTMLLLDVAAERKMPRLDDGLYRYDLVYSFERRNHGTPGVGGDAAQGVDYIYDLANSRWDLITTDGSRDGGRLFEEDDFNTLFEWGE